MKSIPSPCSELELLKDLEEVRELGHGGNGRVFHVREKSTGREFALKWIRLEYSEDSGLSNDAYFALQKQQWDEIFSMKALSSTEEIVSIEKHAFYTHPDGLCVDSFILMELLTPLDTLLHSQALTIGQSARMVADISRALTACHRAKIIHGDVKPDNILADGDGFKLADFGVSLRLQKNKHRLPGGTLYYLPPECLHSGEATVCGDVYSFGMTLYTLFNDGLLPFQKEATQADEEAAWQQCLLLAGQGTGSYPPPRYAPGRIADVLLHATAINSADRYPTPRAFADAYLEAASSLTQEQQAQPLPYGRHRAVYRSTRAATPSFRNNIKSRNSVAAQPVSPFSMQSGFRDVPSAAPVPTLQAVPTEPQPTPHRKKPVLLIALLSCAVLAVIALLLLLPALHRPLGITAQPDSFSAALTLTDAREAVTLQVLASGSEAGYELVTGDAGITLSGLAPETDYIVQAVSGSQTAQAAFRTAPASARRFMPLRQALFTCDAALVRQAESLHELTNLSSDVHQLTVHQLALRNTTLFAQNLSILLSCATQYEPPGTFEDSTLLLVLRTPDDVITRSIDVPAHTKNSSRFHTTHDFSPLFDEYFSRHHRHYQGVVCLEVYWLNELLGSAELMLTDGRTQ